MIPKNTPLILISNDDGYSSKGISTLVQIAEKFGYVIVVAPETGQSGMSHAITAKTPIRLRKIRQTERSEWYAVSGTPVDCIKMAINQIVPRKPDFVFSGINHGSNSSVAVIYSGTVGAAAEGTLLGIPSVAFSQLDYSSQVDAATMEQWLSPIIRKVIEEGLPSYTLLNVNVPQLPSDEIKGYKFCRVTRGYWKEELDKRQDPNGNDYYWLTGSFYNSEPEATDTDESALANGYVAIVPIHIDWTSNSMLKHMKESWNLTAAETSVSN